MLELTNLCFDVSHQDNTKEIVHNINLTIGDNRFVVITGPNGSGKSTLAKLIMGIERPTSGTIRFGGQDITRLGITDRAKMGIGFAFQQPVRFKGLCVHDLVALAAGRSLTSEEACNYLSEVGLCARDYINREVDSRLSGGELKRIEIAMMIARDTKLMLFDEPEAGIDLWSFHQLIRVFENLREKTKGTIILISHQERILQIADTLIVLSGGQIDKMGTAQELLPELLAHSDTCSYYKGA